MKKVAVLTVLVLSSMVSAQQIRVGLAYDTGGKSDKSFNQSAYGGAQAAEKRLGVLVKDFEPKDAGQTTQGVRSFAKSGFDLIIGVGFNNTASITQVAKENPDIFFGLIDDVSPQKNVASLIFNEQEGSYLVGYLAALNSSTGVIGFLGGMDVPLIHKFQAGYEAGAKAANPKIRVVAQYVGTTPDAWNNPAKAKEIAASMKSRGADIIFSAAGASGNGLVEYIKQTQCIKAQHLPSGVKFQSDNFKAVAKSKTYAAACGGNSRPLFFIGVDSNQNFLGDYDKNPATLNHGLTSMVKGVDKAVYTLIEEVKNDKFKGGERRFGLKEDGVGYSYDVYNRALITKEQLAKVNDIKARIISGAIIVPSK